ncbi:MAG: F0F1 ATP synthase subunit B [Saprospiraceae bacterium]
MFFLADFSVIKPDVGLLFWTTIFFFLFWMLIGKFAFKPISEALRKRTGDIQDALDQAKKAKDEMQALNSKNEDLIKEAQEQRALIMKEAKSAKESIINEAKVKAKEEANRIVSTAKAEIEAQKKAALLEVKNEVGQMALGIAEKVIRKELQGNADQESFVNKLVGEIKLN